eukprot:6405356-Pyramimonas_sp.AAC.1
MPYLGVLGCSWVVCLGRGLSQDDAPRKTADETISDVFGPSWVLMRMRVGLFQPPQGEATNMWRRYPRHRFP